MSYHDVLFGGNNRNGIAREESRTNNTYDKFEYAEPVTIDGFRILAINLIETGTYNPEFLRPYTVSTTSEDLTALADITEENNSKRLNPDDIAGIAGNILRYSSTVSRGDLIEVENGLDEVRLSFLLEVEELNTAEYEFAPQSNNVTYITGFTDRLDFAETVNGLHPADDLVFYVTNIHRIERNTRRIVANNQILVPAYHRQGYGNANKELFVNRPRDVLYDEMSRERTPEGSSRLNAANHLAGAIPKTSRQTNLSPSNYLASTINALITGGSVRHGSDPYGVVDVHNRTNAYSKAASMLGEDTLYTNNSFMTLLRNRTSTFQTRSTFSWGDLCQIFGRDVNRVASLYKRKSLERSASGQSRYSQAGDAAGWDCTENGGYNAVFATALKQTLPGFALSSMIYSCRIEATNIVSPQDMYDAYHGCLITISNIIFVARQPTQSEEDRLIDQLKESIASGILKDVSLNNSIPYDVVVELDWRHDTFIWVGIDRGPMIDFSTASFINALTPPVITTDYNLTEDLAADVKAAVNEIMGRR